MAGLAGLLAAAMSMALREWLVQSARELYANQLRVELAELAEMPDEEEAEAAVDPVAIDADAPSSEADRLLKTYTRL